MSSKDSFVSNVKFNEDRLKVGSEIKVPSSTHATFTFAVKINESDKTHSVRALVTKVGNIPSTRFRLYTLSKASNGYIKVTPGWS